MPKNVVMHDLLVSCPGDIVDELRIINKVVELFNEQFSDTLGLMIRIRHWSKSSFAESGGKPQELLNKQFVKECDAALALFWTRFGTPTDQYGSGSEEEIQIMIDAGKQVFVGFCGKAIKPEQIDFQQYNEVQNFKSKYSKNGVYFSYSNDDDFEKILYAQITKYYLSRNAVEEEKNRKKSDLILKSIIDGKLVERLNICQFRASNHQTNEEMLEKIKYLYIKISSYEIDNDVKTKTMQNSMINAAFEFRTPVSISEDDQILIKEVAQSMDLKIDNDFFSLGSLGKNAITLNGGYLGSEEEKKKFIDLTKLINLLKLFIKWSPVERLYSTYRCIELALSNEGKTFDEDIDITISFSYDSIILHSDLPMPEEESLKYIVEKCNINDIFGIPSTSNFNSYHNPHSSLKIKNHLDLGYDLWGRNYKKDFRDYLNSLFNYDYYLVDGKVLLKLHVNYLKQHTAVAFPSIIFVSENIKEINYSITSKYNGDILNGCLKI